VSPLTVRVAVEAGALRTLAECDVHATEELEAIRARLDSTTQVFEGTRFELRGLDVCMLTGLVE
jgi:hypothetical protein